jgi:hypothetical protein
MEVKMKKRIRYVHVAFKCTYCDPESNKTKDDKGEYFQTGFMQSKFLDVYQKGIGESIFCDRCGRLIGNYHFEKKGALVEEDEINGG